jgi:phage virion morphogenesis protein
MSGVSFTVDDRAVMRALQRMQSRAGNLRPVLKSIGQVLVTETDLAFREERDPWGHAWAALSPVTKKRRRGTTAHILSDTGRLRGSINARVQDDSVAVGTNVVYAGTQQFGAAQGAFGKTKRGAPIPWGNIPVRPFLPIRNGSVDLPSGARQDILDIVAKALEKAL